MEVDFDPSQISFAEIVDLFWNSHDPRCGIRSAQYMSAIWFHNKQQQGVIDSGKAAVEEKWSGRIQTPVLPLDVFYPAEDYHQKYRLQNSPLRNHFRAMYSKFEDFNNSTAAARLNGFIAGNGSQETFDEEHQQYGCPVEDLRQLIRLSGSSRNTGACSSQGFGP